MELIIGKLCLTFVLLFVVGCVAAHYFGEQEKNGTVPSKI